MAQATSIEWCDFTANPLKYRDKASGKTVWACVKHSPGCAHCYAEALAKRFGRGGPFTKAEMEKVEPFLDEKELRHLLKSPKLAGKRVFIEDMSDLFGEWVPDEMLDLLFATFFLRPDVTWQILTKRAVRLRDYLAHPSRAGLVQARAFETDKNPIHKPDSEEIAEWFLAHLMDWPLPNVWLGVSVENQKYADERIPLLLQTPAAVRFLSCEPLLGPLNLEANRMGVRPWHDEPWLGVDWVIVGGESGAGARSCDVAWIRSIVEQCKAAGVACFVKQLGSQPIECMGNGGCNVDPADCRKVGGNCRLQFRDKKGGTPDEWPSYLRVRQFPQARQEASA